MEQQEFDWNQHLSSDPSEIRGFGKQLAQRIEEAAAKNTSLPLPPSRTRRPLYIAAATVAALAVLSVGGYYAFQQIPGPHLITASFQGPITDSDTPQQLPVLSEIKASMQTAVFRMDSMDRGHHEFGDERIVIDPNGFHNVAPKRGEIVFFKDSSVEIHSPSQPDGDVARVVALPGEKVKIVQGQVYVNDRKLDTFYGREVHTGQPVENSQVNVPEFTIPQGTVYALADNWWRWRNIGSVQPIAISDLKGKVIGILGTP